MWYLWGATALVMLLLEVVTPSALVSVWFAGGAIVAMALAWLNVPFWLQMAAFLVVSLVLLMAFRPWAVNQLRGKVEPTNADRVIGKTALLSEPIPANGWGKLNIHHVEWNAVSKSGQAIPAGTEVRILRIEGAKLVVVPLERETI